MRNRFTYSLVLQHDAKNVAGSNASFGSTGEKSRSKYKGGFEQKNGRPNNTRAYNHDYYIHNKDKWHDGRPVGQPTASSGVNVRVFDMDGSYDLNTLGGTFTHVNPYQIGYYIDWNDPDSVFRNYKKYSMSAFENSYGGMAEGQKAAFNMLTDPSYGNPNRVLYDDRWDDYYVVTTDRHAIDLFKKSGGSTSTIGDQEVALYTYHGKRDDQSLSSDYFMRQQAAKKLMARSMQRGKKKKKIKRGTKTKLSR